MAKHTIVIEETVSQTFEVELPDDIDPFEWTRMSYKDATLLVDNSNVVTVQFSVDNSEFDELD